MGSLKKPDKSERGLHGLFVFRKNYNTFYRKTKYIKGEKQNEKQC